MRACISVKPKEERFRVHSEFLPCLAMQTADIATPVSIILHAFSVCEPCLAWVHFLCLDMLSRIYIMACAALIPSRRWVASVLSVGLVFDCDVGIRSSELRPGLLTMSWFSSLLHAKYVRLLLAASLHSDHVRSTVAPTVAVCLYGYSTSPNCQDNDSVKSRICPDLLRPLSRIDLGVD